MVNIMANTSEATVLGDMNRETIAVVSDLLTGLRHELGNLITVLNLDVDALDLGLSANKNGRVGVGELRHTVNDLNKLLTRLRAYPRPDSSHAPFDLHQAALEVVERARHSDRPEIVFRAYGSSIWFNGDETALRRALTNIVENAIEATPVARAKPIEFNIHSQGSFLVMTISDHGLGFSDEELETGAPFWPGYTTKISDGFLRGLGLGLFVAQAIVDLHDGAIRLQNRPEGGALVTVTLPRLIEASYADSEIEYKT